jgi:transcriptional regulator with XRE-family HTH domain
MLTKVSTPPLPSPEPRGAQAVGRLLRSRRERLSPQEVGLPVGARRRTPGLRREEVALLADVSVTYYTVLEQGRARQPSRQVLDALASALRLTEAERDYLYTLSNGGGHGAGSTDETIAPRVRELVDQLNPYPSYVTGKRWDVLAANRAARALFTDWSLRPAEDQNMLKWMFTDPRAREVYVEWHKESAAQLARYRAAVARRPGDRLDQILINELHRDSAEVREWWPRHDVAPLSSGVKLLRHGALGELCLEHVVLQVADQPDQKLVTFSDPGHGIDRLRVLSASLPSS